MSHPFGDLLSQHLHRKHGLSQSKLAAGILQEPAIITKMCKGERLTGPQSRERVVAIIGWLHKQGALETVDEANTLLAAAGMAPLYAGQPVETALRKSLRPSSDLHSVSKARLTRNHNLPAPSNQVIGRETDIVAASRLLNHDDVRLITFVGPPGVGKTRLAIEVARAASGGFADGAWLVPLAPVTDPDLVASTIAQVLNINLTDGLPPIESVKRFLADKRMLLVLDNLEQILDAATAIAEVLAVAPDVKVVATSRAALRLSAEHLFDVLPLPLSSAVALFVARAQAIQPRFALTDELGSHTVVAAICERVDRLPLAIELAAARMRQFSPHTLRESLEQSSLRVLTSGPRDLPARQQTLRDTIDWSYNLLTAEQQRLLRCLSAFVGDCTLEAAQGVAGNLPSFTSDVQALLDNSLIQRSDRPDGESRFTLLEMMREYALERLEAHDELDIVRQRHAAYYLALVKGEVLSSAKPVGRLQPSLLRIPQAALWTKSAEHADRLQPSLQLESKSPWEYWTMSEYMAWCELLAPEHDNLRAALSWSLADAHDPEVGIDLVLWLHGFWYARGPWSETIYWLECALAKIESSAHTHARARLLASLSHFVGVVSNYAHAERLAREALAICRELGDQLDIAFALGTVVNALRERGNFTEAETLGEEWLAVSMDLEDRYNIGVALFNLGEIALAHGDAARAAVRLEQSHSVWRELGDKDYVALVLNVQGNLACCQGDYERATTLCRDALVTMQKMGSTHGVATTLLSLGDIALFQNDMSQAKQLFEEGLLSFHYNGNRQRASWGLAGLAALAATEEHAQRAVTLWEVAEAIRASIGNPRAALHHKNYRERVVIASSGLDEQVLNASVTAGRAMTLEQAVEYALSNE